MRCHVAVVALALPLSMAAQQKEGFPPDNPDSWRLAGTAKCVEADVTLLHVRLAVRHGLLSS